MDAELFINHPGTQFERPLRGRSASPKRSTPTHPDQGVSSLANADDDDRFEDFVPIVPASESLTIAQVNARLEQALGGSVQNITELHANLSSDTSFQDVLRGLKARLTFSPDGRSLRVEANGKADPSRPGGIDFFPLRPSNLPPSITPKKPAEPPPVIFAPEPPPNPRPFYVPSIPATQSFVSQVDLDTFGMQTALFYQQEIIQFADAIAGHLDYTTPTPVLQSGFEDLIRLANKLEQSNQQFIASFRDTGTPAPSQPGQTVTYTIANGGAGLVELSPSERQAAERLRALTQELQNPNQALSLYREERLREGRERNIQLEWAALPVKLQTMYFTSNVSAAINYCLNIVAKNTRGLPRERLLDIIIRSDAREPFAQLVASYIRRNRGGTPNSYHTGIQYKEFDQRYHASIRELSQCNFQPILVPPFIKMLKLNVI